MNIIKTVNVSAEPQTLTLDLPGLTAKSARGWQLSGAPTDENTLAAPRRPARIHTARQRRADAHLPGQFGDDFALEIADSTMESAPSTMESSDSAIESAILR